MVPSVDITVVIPLLNEEESLPELTRWICKVAESHGLSYEIWFIDDGSTDNSWHVIESLSDDNPNVKGVRFRRNYGKSAALQTGFLHSNGDVVVTMDADLQDSPDEIPGLYKMITQDGYDLVSGYKKKRFDPLSKTIPTKLFNGVTRMMSGIPLRDFNCGLKAYRADVIKSIEVYGEMHRYIPVIAKWSGFDKIGEKVVSHQPRKYGRSKFGVERFINGFLDLLSITFIGKFGQRPMHFFGLFGILIFFIGFLVLFYLSMSKIFGDETGIADRPLFYFGITALIVGAQFFMTGFIAELISRSSHKRNDYNISEIISSSAEKNQRKEVLKVKNR